MAGITENTVRKDLPDDLLSQGGNEGLDAVYSDPAHAVMNLVPVDELRRRSESLIENIGALRFSIARIEQLSEQKRIYRELLTELSAELPGEYLAWTSKIRQTLEDTAE